MPYSTEERQARLIALPTAVLLAVLTMSVSDPVIRLQEAMASMDFVREVKQAYPENALIQGIFAESDSLLRALHLSSLSENQALWRALRLYIEDARALLDVDTESTEFRAFLVALVKKLAKDVEQGLFGHDPALVQAQREYLSTLKLQFSLVPSKPIDNDTLL
jgi:hypothetical protein